MQNWNMFQMAKNHSGVNQSIASFYKTFFYIYYHKESIISCTTTETKLELDQFRNCWKSN